VSRSVSSAVKRGAQPSFCFARVVSMIAGWPAASTHWAKGGCTSWYLDADGVNRALWPGFSFEYWARTRRARAADYAIR
jgi:hypothetical protein